eukprot:2462878-Rhodomonas_salina.1
MTACAVEKSRREGGRTRARGLESATEEKGGWEVLDLGCAVGADSFNVDAIGREFFEDKTQWAPHLNLKQRLLPVLVSDVWS